MRCDSGGNCKAAILLLVSTQSRFESVFQIQCKVKVQWGDVILLLIWPNWGDCEWLGRFAGLFTPCFAYARPQIACDARNVNPGEFSHKSPLDTKHISKRNLKFDGVGKSNISPCVLKTSSTSGDYKLNVQPGTHRWPWFCLSGRWRWVRESSLWACMHLEEAFLPLYMHNSSNLVSTIVVTVAKVIAGSLHKYILA